jgi:hypothetical protein
MLKFIVSPIVGLLAYALLIGLGHLIFGSGYSYKTGSGIPFLITILVGVSAIIITFKSFPKKSIKSSVADSFSFVKDTANEISSMVNEDDSNYYAIAEQEINDGVTNKGLWSQALVAADGDESKRKIEYMKLRVKQLKKR